MLRFNRIIEHIVSKIASLWCVCIGGRQFNDLKTAILCWIDPTVLLTSHPIGAPVVPVGIPKVGPVILSPIPPSFNPKIGELETTS